MNDQAQQDRNIHYDGWRGLAIVLVLVSHFLTIPGFFAGKFGVAIFFVLSGALMSNILFIKRIPLALFYKRRISRILPVFILYVSLTYIYALNISSPETKNFFYTLSFLRAYFPEQPDMWSTDLPINHIWSLNVEEHCYILLSLITLITLFRGKEYIPLLALGTLSTLVFGYYVHSADYAPPLFQIRTEAISSFLLLSSGYFLIKHKIDSFILPWMPLLAFFLAAACFTHLPWYFPFMLAPFLLAFSFHHLSKMPTLVLKVLAWQPLRTMGIWSYSIYLWQHPFFFYIEQTKVSSSGVKIVLMLCAIGTGIISFYLVENPVRKYLNEHWK